MNGMKLLFVLGIALYIGHKAGFIGGLFFGWLAFVVLFV